MVRYQTALIVQVVLTGLVVAQAPPSPSQPSQPMTNPVRSAAPGAVRDAELVERLIAARKEYQASLEALRNHYISVGDLEKG
ncbi:MAG: hypothetical protein ACKOS8_13965, partial [Gemmataceae bacterium]